MADEATPAGEPVSPAAEPVVPDLFPPADPPARAVPDSVTLTPRELASHVEKAVAKAMKQAQSTAMSDKTPDPTPTTPPAPAFSKEQFEQLQATAAEALAAAKAATENATKLQEDANKQISELRTRAEAAEQRAEEEAKRRRRAKDKVVEANLRKAAAKAGIEDEDYALVLYARAAGAAVNKKDAEGNAAPESPPAPEEFFAALAKAKPGLLKTPPPPVPANSTPAAADPGSSAAPPPARAGTTPAEPRNADDMDDREFAAQTRSKYGFNPTIAV